MKNVLMKKTALMKFCLWMLLPMLALTACEEDGGDDDDGLIGNIMVGTWDVTGATFRGTIGDIDVGTLTATTQGTITFRENGTGQESYSFTIEGITIRESDAFSWVSTPTQVIFDGGTSDQTIWNREVNEQNTQRASYAYQEDEAVGTITVTISR